MPEFNKISIATCNLIYDTKIDFIIVIVNFKVLLKNYSNKKLLQQSTKINK